MAHVIDTKRRHNNCEDLELITSAIDTVSVLVNCEDLERVTSARDTVSVLVESIHKDLTEVPSLPSNCSIYRVPKPLLEIKPEAYTPRMVSIGPFHRYKKHLQTMEAHKLRYLNDLLGRESAATLGDYVKAMTELEDRARQCYSEIIRLKFEDEFVKMMLLDGCFIVELILRTNSDKPARYHNDPILNAKWMFHAIKRDLILLENQLPFFVLERLYNLFKGDSYSSRDDPSTSFSNHVCQFLGDFVPQPQTITVPQPQTITPKSSRLQRTFEVVKSVFDFVSVTRKPEKKDHTESLESHFMEPRLNIVKFDQVELKAFSPSNRMAVCSSSIDGGIAGGEDSEGNRKAKHLLDQVELKAFSPSNRMAVVSSSIDRGTVAAVVSSSIDRGTTAFSPSDRMAVDSSSIDRGTAGGEDSEGNRKAKHLLDFIRNLLLQSSSGAPENRGVFMRTRNATELYEASVKFEKGPTKCLLDITFTNGVLKLPTMKIEDWTESLLRNLIAYEQSHDDYHNDITAYAAFIDGLIDSPKDVELLQRKGIIESLLGDPEEVATLYNSLLKEVTITDKDFYFSGVCSEVEKYYKKPWHQWKASLMLNYFNTPWAFISFLAAVFLLVLTVVQTMCSILAL